jgi:hypothetical protein
VGLLSVVSLFCAALVSNNRLVGLAANGIALRASRATARLVPPGHWCYAFFLLFVLSFLQMVVVLLFFLVLLLVSSFSRRGTSHLGCLMLRLWLFHVKVRSFDSFLVLAIPPSIDSRSKTQAFKPLFLLLLKLLVLERGRWGVLTREDRFGVSGVIQKARCLLVFIIVTVPQGALSGFDLTRARRYSLQSLRRRVIGGTGRSVSDFPLAWGRSRRVREARVILLRGRRVLAFRGCVELIRAEARADSRLKRAVTRNKTAVLCRRKGSVGVLPRLLQTQDSLHHRGNESLSVYPQGAISGAYSEKALMMQKIVARAWLKWALLVDIEGWVGLEVQRGRGRQDGSSCGTGRAGGQSSAS